MVYLSHATLPLCDAAGMARLKKVDLNTVFHHTLATRHLSFYFDYPTEFNHQRVVHRLAHNVGQGS